MICNWGEVCGDLRDEITLRTVPLMRITWDPEWDINSAIYGEIADDRRLE
jgi:hypothetical protein